MIIAFCGPSGSGKTTLLKEIYKNSFPFVSNIKVYDEDSFLLLKFGKKILGSSKFDAYNKAKMSKGAITYTSSIFSALTQIFYPLIVFTEYMVLYILYKKLFRKKILICDRWAYDYLITFNENLSLNNTYINFLFKRFPKPDLIFYLQIDTKTALSRNKSGRKFSKTKDAEFHNRIINSYKNISKSKRMIVINTAKNNKNAINEVKKFISDRNLLINIGEIAITGVDGTGKSTVAELLNDYCRLLGINSKVVHFYHSNIILKIIRMLNLESNQEINDKKNLKEKNAKKINRHPIIKLCLAFFHFIDSYMQYLISRIIYRNSVLIFDRFFLDYIVSFKYYEVSFNNLFDNLSPKTKNLFVLFVDPKVAYIRKPEAYLDFYKFSNIEYKKLVEEENLKIINTNKKSPDRVVSELIEKLEI